MATRKSYNSRCKGLQPQTQPHVQNKDAYTFGYHQVPVAALTINIKTIKLLNHGMLHK